MSSNIKIKTAVIPVAGYGTRRLPITKSIEKCMLPIGNRPIVDYVVADCAAAGIEHVIFVVSEGSSQIQNYYGHNLQLEKYLEERGKTKELEMVQNTGRGLKFSYVTQPQDGAYGTAVPVHLVADRLNNEEAFAVLMGDDCIFREDGGSELKEAIEAFNTGEAKHLMMASQVSRELAPNFGVLQLNSRNCLTSIIEKPPIDLVTEPSMINVSKFIFNRSMLGFLSDYMKNNPHPDHNEYFITDVLMRLVGAGEEVAVKKISGMILDAGNMKAWLRANNIAIHQDY